MRYLALLSAVVFAGCAPSPAPTGVIYVTSPVAEPTPAEPLDILEVPTPDPEPVTVVVPEPEPEPEKPAEQPPAPNAPKQATPNPPSATKASNAGGQYNEAPRRGLFRGRLFGRGGGGA